ncbi:unnamed protein product [Effrenium voratum]|uniref:Uncharacterized protein n=1 Tax=Effrenium voratum TaxID=2562239 RepID=A0AA36IIU9_9DINO|nr:unnamed protein product [Effrenium voratum]
MARPWRHVVGAARCCSSSAGSQGLGVKDAGVVFASLSKSIYRGFKFDRMFPSDDLDPQAVKELEQLALMSLKTQDAPRQVMEKIVRLLRDFGQKKDLQRYGRYLLKRQRSRTSTEVPQVLPSEFLPESDHDNGPLAQMRKNPAFKDLFDHAGVRNLNDSTMRRLAIAHKEDRRHVLYQMFWSPEAALTYLAHRYPATWAVNFRVLFELARRAPDFQPKRVMDYGAGPCPSLAAVQEIWPNVMEYVTAVEPSEHMTQLGKYLMTDLEMPPIHWQRSLYDSTDEGLDLILLSYVQMEVKGQDSRDALIKRLWSRLRPGGVLVLIEPGTPTGFRFMHHTREMLISRVGPENFHFVAPCPHEGMCPLALTGRDWCHFAQRVRRTPHRVYCKGSKKRFMEEEKFSFLCIRRAPGPRSKYRCEEHAPTPQEKTYFWPRIMFPVIKAGGHTMIDVCSAPQNFERLSVSRSRPHSFGYRWSRQAMWGDLWRFPKRIARPEARAYIPEKTREHLDRLAKRAWKALKWQTQEPGFEAEKDITNPPMYLSDLVRQYTVTPAWMPVSTGMPTLSWSPWSWQIHGFNSGDKPEQSLLTGSSRSSARTGTSGGRSSVARSAGWLPGLPQGCEDDFECNDGKANFPLQCCEMPLLGKFCCEPPDDFANAKGVPEMPAWVPLPVPVEEME